MIFHGLIILHLCGFCDWLEAHLIAEPFDLAGEALGFGLGGSMVEVGDAEILVEGSILEHVIDRSQDRGRDGADRFLRAAPGSQAQELRLVVAVVRPLGGPGALNQHGLQPRGALAQSGALALAGALVLAATEARPGDQMAGRGKAAHVRADLREDSERRQLSDPRDRGEELDQAGKSGLIGRFLRVGRRPVPELRMERIYEFGDNGLLRIARGHEPETSPMVLEPCGIKSPKTPIAGRRGPGRPAATGL